MTLLFAPLCWNGFEVLKRCNRCKDIAITPRGEVLDLCKGCVIVVFLPAEQDECSSAGVKENSWS